VFGCRWRRIDKCALGCCCQFCWWVGCWGWFA
jgi:hypothetical protein